MTSKRICLFCKKIGIVAEFETGNELRRHIRDKHPHSTTSVAVRDSVRRYRKQQILTGRRLNGTKVD